MKTLWEQTEIPDIADDLTWETFHENSKTGKYAAPLSNDAIIEAMQNLHESLPYPYLEKMELPADFEDIDKSFHEIVLSRRSPRKMEGTPMSLKQLKTILFYAYGETRDNQDSEYFVRPFRTVASGGGLYPLELYFYSHDWIEGVEPGIWHYNPAQNCIELVKRGDFRKEIEEGIVSFQSDLAYNTSLIIFITAIFRRSTFKYRDKGYRFALFEAGHVAQNLNLTGNGLGFGVLNIGGYHDRYIDELLDLDGLYHSTIYLNGFGKTIY